MIPKQIVIVGGGTAGWMAATLMANRWSKHGASITLVESSKIGTIGVGEGSTPFLRQFFQTLNISEKQWMAKCDATYKCGIAFPNWCNTNEAESYFHPFYGEIDSPLVKDFFNNCQYRREGFDIPTLPDDYFINAYLAQQNKSPKTTNLQYQGIDYGYHFDADKLGSFLASHAKKLGVKQIQDQVVDIKTNTLGIESIITQQKGEISGDLFVDCSGLKGILIQQTLKEELIDYQKYIPNNRAVAIGTNHKEPSKFGTYTLSKGLKNGWMWSIPLSSRIGNGYVYSSKYMSSEDAEKELREQLNEYDAPARHIKWSPGRISQHWKQNCLALGLSQGFLEPLEAPMLNLVQQTCESFIEFCEKPHDLVNNQQKFNQVINRLIDGTRDYLQAHYLLNSRSDSQYWIDNRNNTDMSSTLMAIVSGWKSQGSFDTALATISDNLVYGKTSWYCILSGMNYYHTPTKGSLRLAVKKHHNAKLRCQHIAVNFPIQVASKQN
ncbi:tryptophan 7-halogenase [Paraglaciecola aquimarina]|uniref:Tryptophan 7-halogenase n=1 Tax=Paraglaciecola algarum TaxID=3050085 RepID=A0ABS9DAW5_9ALTE|nr:tryptophan halogenase family protein [Paraglaciecola sp. G1-23]MCF2948939.1 tryptophan 7-halogenase [Paraglaciecola sp. G1-23]